MAQRRAKSKPRQRVQKLAPAERQREATQTPPARRDEVLEAALRLVSEHGVAGASLRKLAAELGMSQPSLYHYFPSKEALLTELIEYGGRNMMQAAATEHMPKSAADLPGYVRDITLRLWESERHPRFVRFMLVVAVESPAHRERIQQLFEERLYPGFSFAADAFAADAAEREEIARVMRMVVYSLGLALLEERAIFHAKRPSSELLRQADWVVAAGQRLLADFARRRGKSRRR